MRLGEKMLAFRIEYLVVVILAFTNLTVAWCYVGQ